MWEACPRFEEGIPNAAGELTRNVCSVDFPGWEAPEQVFDPKQVDVSFLKSCIALSAPSTTEPAAQEGPLEIVAKFNAAFGDVYSEVTRLGMGVSDSASVTTHFTEPHSLSLGDGFDFLSTSDSLIDTPTKPTSEKTPAAATVQVVAGDTGIMKGILRTPDNSKRTAAPLAESTPVSKHGEGSTSPALKPAAPKGKSTAAGPKSSISGIGSETESNVHGASEAAASSGLREFTTSMVKASEEQHRQLLNVAHNRQRRSRLAMQCGLGMVDAECARFPTSGTFNKLVLVDCALREKGTEDFRKICQKFSRDRQEAYEKLARDPSVTPSELLSAARHQLDRLSMPNPPMPSLLFDGFGGGTALYARVSVENQRIHRTRNPSDEHKECVEAYFKTLTELCKVPNSDPVNETLSEQAEREQRELQHYDEDVMERFLSDSVRFSSMPVAAVDDGLTPDLSSLGSLISSGLYRRGNLDALNVSPGRRSPRIREAQQTSPAAAGSSNAVALTPQVVITDKPLQSQPAASAQKASAPKSSVPQLTPRLPAATTAPPSSGEAISISSSARTGAPSVERQKEKSATATRRSNTISLSGDSGSPRVHSSVPSVAILDSTIQELEAPAEEQQERSSRRRQRSGGHDDHGEHKRTRRDPSRSPSPSPDRELIESSDHSDGGSGSGASNSGSDDSDSDSDSSSGGDEAPSNSGSDDDDSDGGKAGSVAASKSGSVEGSDAESTTSDAKEKEASASEDESSSSDSEEQDDKNKKKRKNVKTTPRKRDSEWSDHVTVEEVRIKTRKLDSLAVRNVKAYEVQQAAARGSKDIGQTPIAVKVAMHIEDTQGVYTIYRIRDPEKIRVEAAKPGPFPYPAEFVPDETRTGPVPTTGLMTEAYEIGKLGKSRSYVKFMMPRSQQDLGQHLDTFQLLRPFHGSKALTRKSAPWPEDQPKDEKHKEKTTWEQAFCQYCTAKGNAGPPIVNHLFRVHYSMVAACGRCGKVWMDVKHASSHWRKCGADTRDSEPSRTGFKLAGRPPVDPGLGAFTRCESAFLRYQAPATSKSSKAAKQKKGKKPSASKGADGAGKGEEKTSPPPTGSDKVPEGSSKKRDRSSARRSPERKAKKGEEALGAKKPSQSKRGRSPADSSSERKAKKAKKEKKGKDERKEKSRKDKRGHRERSKERSK